MNIVGLLGPAGSGKDLVADWLVQYRRYTKVAFADVMKRIARDIFNFDTALFWGPSQHRNEDQHTNWEHWRSRLRDRDLARRWGQELGVETKRTLEFEQGFHDWFESLAGKCPHKISTRVILQTMGTEMGRGFDPLFWVRYVYEDVIPQIKRGWDYTPWYGVLFSPEKHFPRGIVIPDHRFENEVYETKRRRGYMVRIRRMALAEADIGISGHASEAEQRAITDSIFHLVLELPEGVDKVHAALEAAFDEGSYG